jgi:hypothetical protein
MYETLEALVEREESLLRCTEQLDKTDKTPE